MAAGTGRRRVAPGQRKLRACRMIETPVAPGRRTVAVVARLGKQGRFMIRVHCRRVIVQMTRDTFLRRPLVHSVLMTTGTGFRRVAPRQRKLRAGRVIENSSGPLRRTVAHRTILRESGGNVVRILCAIIRTQMAGFAFL